MNHRGRVSILVGGILLVGGTWTRAASRPDIIAVPAGSFIMGRDNGPADERPAHRLELGAFSIDRTPVTNGQFAVFLNAVGSFNSRGEKFYDLDDSDARIRREGHRWLPLAGFENHPVVEVPWFGAHAYCIWAGKRLPTEAEWEKAARGGDERRFPWGNDLPDSNRARFNAGWNQTLPVGQFPKGASPYGVLDMAGNVWQWVSSGYFPYPYHPRDGREDLKPGPVRGTRGGGHDSPTDELAVSHRGRDLSRNFRSGHHNIGFRCAR